MRRGVRVLFALGVAFAVAAVARYFASATVAVTDLTFLLGGLAALCLAGVVFGVWSARRTELRRKTREDIWINH